MYFKARRSTWIKVGRPQPQSKEPIIIEDTTAKQKEESPSKISITYERRSPKTSTWRERIRMMDSKKDLQEAETVLQETLAKLKETEKLKEKAAKPSQEEEKAEEILEPSPQPSLGSYYNLLEAGKRQPNHHRKKKRLRKYWNQALSLAWAHTTTCYIKVFTKVNSK